MKIVFIGSVIFSKKALEKLISVQADVVGIVTKEKSDFNTDFCDLTSIANQHHIPSKYVSNINDEDVVEWIKSLTPDVLFCFGWSNLLKKEILEVSPIGVIGFHPTLLPYNKGRHPLIWAKILGLKESGSTFFFMDEGADTGDILSQKKFLIEFDDDAAVLYEKLTSTALQQIEDFLPLMIQKNFNRIPQQKDKGNSWRKRGGYDGKIDFRMSTESICNLVRGLSRPYVGAHCIYKESDVKIWKVNPGDCQYGNIEPGKVISIKNQGIEIKTSDSSVILIEHDFEIIPQINEYIL